MSQFAAFCTSFFLIFMAEMGDKTQFMTMALSAKHSSTVVLSGVALGTLVISLISVILGQTVGTFLSKFWLNLLAGLAFIAFGLWSLRGDNEEEEGEKAAAEEEKREANAKPGALRPIIAVATAFFVAELGDKTMLATIVIAGREHNHFTAVWLGSTLGLLCSNALGILAGKVLANKLSAQAMHYLIAAIYIISGGLAIFEAFKG
ncbi:MAG TPA: TMEM165/GDT1 family protein [Oculatellaceae cyanobacterium]